LDLTRFPSPAILKTRGEISGRRDPSEEGNVKYGKRGVFWALIALVFLAAPYGRAATTKIAMFRGTEIPFDLKRGEDVIKQGKYDLEVHFSKVDTNVLYLLRVMQKGKSIHEIPGQGIAYQSQTIQTLMKDPKIPDKPTLRFRKIPDTSIVDLIFESGKTGNFRFMKAFFRMEQVQE
jgi:hypothetical protein